MSEETVEKARNLDCLEESPKKEKLFAVKDYDYMNNHQVIYVDLREGFSIYGYDAYGDQLDIKRRKLPQEVKDLESHEKAEGSAKLGEFA